MIMGERGRSARKIIDMQRTSACRVAWFNTSLALRGVGDFPRHSSRCSTAQHRCPKAKTDVTVVPVSSAKRFCKIARLETIFLSDTKMFSASLSPEEAITIEAVSAGRRPKWTFSDMSNRSSAGRFPEIVELIKSPLEFVSEVSQWEKMTDVARSNANEPCVRPIELSPPCIFTSLWRA